MNKNNNVVYLSNDFLTNFKPNVSINLKNMSFFKKKKHELYCKNFFLFIYLMKYNLNKNKHSKNIKFKKFNIFIKPLKKKLYTILRSPYRHKLARQQFYILRYNVRLSVSFIFTIFNFYSFNKLISIFKRFKNLSNFIETNIVYTHKVKINFNLYFNNNFKYNIFNNK